METIKPKKLKKGDTIGIISLCGSINDQTKLYNSKRFLEQNGFKVVLSDNILDRKRYLAGEDDEKIRCLNEFFKDEEINAILCSRGGYGAVRLINKLDYSVIRDNPKIFAGYSDVTVLSAMMYKKAGLITFSSPMACSDFGSDNVSEVTSNSFFETLCNLGELILKPINPKIYYEGEAEGVLFGGNLSSIVSLCGIDFIPNEGFIFFAEDLNEDVYKIDKMFRQLLNIERFRKNLSGIILGDFLDITNRDYLEDLFKEVGQEIKKPIVEGFLISHGNDKVTVPIGCLAKLNTSDCLVKCGRYTSD